MIRVNVGIFASAVSIAAAALVFFGAGWLVSTAFAAEGGFVAGDFAASATPTGGQGSSSPSNADSVPMYRLYNSFSGEHFYTSSKNEHDSLVKSSWADEGIAWQAPLKSDIPVFRLYNPDAGDHHFTTSKDERESLVSVGWTDEGVAWYSDAGEGEPLFRLYNPLASSGAHHYTSSTEERTDLVSRGWIAEGIGWCGLAADEPASDNPGSSDAEGTTYTPIYRVYCPATGDHLYTSSKDERNALAAWVWHYEGASWESPSTGYPIYRLKNPYSDVHMFTMSAEESGALVRAGWDYEDVAFRSCADGEEERISIYRLYNPNTGLHHLTTFADERDGLIGAGWQDEGVAWYACSLDDAFEDDLALWEPRISGDPDFDVLIECILYHFADLWSAFDYVAGFPYRSGERFFSGPRILDDSTTKDMAQDMIVNQSGNCYRFASLFCWLARGLGYNANVVSGWVPTYSSSRDPHGWTEIYIDNQIYICDPDMVNFYPGVDWYMRTYDSPPTNYGSW